MLLQPRYKITSQKETKVYKDLHKNMQVENLRMLRKLQDQKSDYDVMRMER